MFKDINELNDVLYGLLKKGFIEMAGINEDGELTYRLTDLGKEFAENYEG